MSIEIILLPIAIAAISAATSKKQTNKEQDYYSIGTLMTDSNLLEKSLHNNGCQSVLKGNVVGSEIQGAKMVFEPTEQDGFRASFFGDIGIDQAEDFLKGLYKEYTRLVQQDVYLKLKDRAASNGFILESEEIQDDNSIVLTLQIQG